MENNNKTNNICQNTSPNEIKQNTNQSSKLFSNKILRQSQSLKSLKINNNLVNLYSSVRSGLNSAKINNNNIQNDNYNNNIIKDNIRSNLIEKYHTRIRIPFNDLQKLNKEQLLDLIQFIDYSCSLTLEDPGYIGSTYSIFTIEKNEISNIYNIIINKNKIDINGNENDFKKEDLKIDKKSNNMLLKNNKNEQNKKSNIIFKEKDNILDINQDKPKNMGIDHNFQPPIICSMHKNEKFQTLNDYFSHYQDVHKEFVCQECGKKYETFKKMKKHIFKMIHKNNKENENNNNNDDPHSINNLNKKHNVENKMVKCFECDLIFNTIENMKSHYYSIHEKSKNKKEDDIKSKDNSKMVNDKFNKWVENRMGNKKEEENKKENKKKEKFEKADDIEDEKEEDQKKIDDIIIRDILESNSVVRKKKEKAKKNKTNNQNQDDFISEKDNKNIHDKKKEENKSNKIYCDICNKEFLSKYAIDAHMKDKHIEYLYCEVCGKFFSSMPALESHCKTKTHHKDLYCEICDRAFTSKQAKENHCKDKNHYQFICKTCNKKFLSLEAKESHCRAKNHL